MLKGLLKKLGLGKNSKGSIEQVTNEAEMPYGVKISRISDEGIEVYWKKPEKADGYEVFRADSADGQIEKIARIETRKEGTYTDPDFDHSLKTVYYSVRSFLREDDSSEVYSGITEPVAAEYRIEMTPEREITYMYSDSSRSISAFYGWGNAQGAVWTSDDTSVAKIDEDGMIHAISAGECTIRCRSLPDGRECTSRVVVDRKPTIPLMPGNPRFHFDAVSGIWRNPDASDTGKAIIMMVGDMMCSSLQMRRQYTEDRGWVFNDSFEYVHPVTSQSDFAIGNLETLLASPWPYMADEAYIDNKNNCNAPARYLDAVRYGGFDAVSLANNHNCDGGVRALLDTIEQVEKYEFPFTGVFRSVKDRHFFIADINGIKVGFVAYMSARTTFNGKDADWTSIEKATHLNVYTDEKAAEDIRRCREAGAEYVIAYMHWGVKNFRSITSDQKKLAVGVADAGADFIVGANPHIVQVYEEIHTESGRIVPCYYSTGNFQATMNQIPGNRDSIMVRIELQKEPDGEILLTDNGYIAFHCYSRVEENRWAPVPLRDRFNTAGRTSKKITKRINDAVGTDAKEIL